jgi:hypothetical protein
MACGPRLRCVIRGQALLSVFVRALTAVPFVFSFSRRTIFAARQEGAGLKYKTLPFDPAASPGFAFSLPGRGRRGGRRLGRTVVAAHVGPDAVADFPVFFQ